MDEWKDALKASISEGNWKSAMFFSEMILRVSCDDLEALFSRSYALYCSKKYAELELFLSKLPSGLAKSESLIIIRCKGLQKTKNYTKIVNILGGNTDTLELSTPLLSLNEVMKSSSLTQIRNNALFNLSHSDLVSPVSTRDTILKNDPLNPTNIASLIIKAMMQRKSAILLDFSLLSDKTTENDPLTLTACGCYCLLNQQIDNGEAFLMKAIDEDPDCEIAWLCLIFYYIESAEWEQGLSALRKVGRRFPQSTNVAMFAMTLHLKSGSPTLAWHWIEQSDTSNVFIKHERAVALMMDGDNAEAAHEFGDVLTMTTEKDILEAASLNLGHCLRRLEKFEAALSRYQQVLSFGSKSAEALSSIGFTYHLMKQYDDAIYYYNRCLGIDPVHPFSTKMLDIILNSS